MKIVTVVWCSFFVAKKTPLFLFSKLKEKWRRKVFLYWYLPKFGESFRNVALSQRNIIVLCLSCCSAPSPVMLRTDTHVLLDTRILALLSVNGYSRFLSTRDRTEKTITSASYDSLPISIRRRRLDFVEKFKFRGSFRRQGNLESCFGDERIAAAASQQSCVTRLGRTK